MNDRTQILTDAGRLMFGDDWQRPIARALGPHHPLGPRESIDDRLVRRWVARTRPVPNWVGPALISLLEAHVASLTDRLEATAAKVELLKATWSHPCPTS